MPLYLLIRSLESWLLLGHAVRIFVARQRKTGYTHTSECGLTLHMPSSWIPMLIVPLIRDVVLPVILSASHRNTLSTDARVPGWVCHHG